MEHTPNYQLPRWALSDPIQMNDFNAAFAAIDTALKANADTGAALTAALGAGGSTCRIACGSYAGTGTAGASGPNALSFGFKPLLLFLINTESTAANEGLDLNQTILVRPAARVLKSWAASAELSVQWTDSGVSWYGDTAYGQLNASTRTYAYVALGVSA